MGPRRQKKTRPHDKLLRQIQFPIVVIYCHCHLFGSFISGSWDKATIEIRQNEPTEVRHWVKKHEKMTICFIPFNYPKVGKSSPTPENIEHQRRTPAVHMPHKYTQEKKNQWKKSKQLHLSWVGLQRQSWCRIDCGDREVHNLKDLTGLWSGQKNEMDITG